MPGVSTGGATVDFNDVIRRRRCVRQFVPSEISDDTLLRIVDAGRIAPSGCNMRNREYIIIRDRDVLQQLNAKVQPAFQDAAAAIALVMDPASTPYGSYWVEDAAAATENMLLAIVNEGYDSVWIEGTLLRQEAWAKALLGVPADKRLYVLLPVGKAAEPGTMAEKPDLDDVTYFGTYGQRR